MKQYAHLSNEERFFIHVALREGKTQKEIADSLGRDPSTISREIRRGMWPRSIIYCYDWGVQFHRWRKQARNRRMPRKLTEEVTYKIESLLKQFLSPEQISNYLKRHHKVSISHETIYRYIFSDPQRKKEFRPYFRQLHKNRRKRYGSGARVSNIPNRVSVTERPAIVDEKKRIGGWECDTVVGSDRKSVLVTVVERKTLFTVSKKVQRKTALAVSQAIITMLKPHKDLVHTLTFDNGSEFTKHERIAKALEAETYFAHPYAS